MLQGHVLIYIHKEQELEDVEAKYPAEHYVMVDDKVRILAAIKKHWGSRVTTVFPRPGTLRARFGGSGAVSEAGYYDRKNWRVAEILAGTDFAAAAVPAAK